MSEIMGLNTFDIIVIALILLLSIKGLINGFIKELFGAIGLIGGIFVASYYNTAVAEYIHTNITDAISIKVLNLLSLIIIFALFWGIISAIGKGVNHLSSNDYISATSRLGGMLVKMVKLFFIFSLIVYAFSTKPQVQKDFKNIIESSKLFPLLQNAGSAILNMAVMSNDVNNETNATKDNNQSKIVTAKESNQSNNTTMQEKTEEKEKLESKTINTKKESNSSDSNTTQN